MSGLPGQEAPEPGGLLLGLTGGIAAGKSAVASALADLGARVIDADEVSRDLQGPGSPVLRALVEEFGPGILGPSGALDRAGLGRQVFGHPERLERLNAITHPPIWRELLARVGAARRRWPVVVLMAPLLFEHGAEALVDQVWVVDLPEAEQLARLMARDGLSAGEARRRVESQWPAREKVERGDVVIDNSGTLEATRGAVERAWGEWVAPLLVGAAAGPGPGEARP